MSMVAYSSADYPNEKLFFLMSIGLKLKTILALLAYEVHIVDVYGCK